MSRAYFCLTHDEGTVVPTLYVNDKALHLSQEEFFRLMTEAVWVSKSIARDAQITRTAENVRKYYNV